MTDRLRDRLAPRPAPRPLLLTPLERLLAFALALQPAVMPLPVGLDPRGLSFEPALMIAEIFLGRDQHLARPHDRLFDDGNGSLERGDSLPVRILVLRRPNAFLTHRTDHEERLP